MLSHRKIVATHAALCLDEIENIGRNSQLLLQFTL